MRHEIQPERAQAPCLVALGQITVDEYEAKRAELRAERHGLVAETVR